ncbi:hypothetical protein B484DRAFT_305941, partial [Ochromonadaceae sp. CCMP2298]
VGLENLGNTCFMNAALQCLLHIEPLVAFFLQGNIEQHLNLASPKKGNLALSFGQLVRDVYRQRAHGSVTPTNLQRAVCVHAPYLMDLQQQDSQEFLRFLLDGIAEDLEAPSQVGEDPELTAAPPVARRWLLARREAELQWTRYMKLNDSVITDMFAGQLQSTVECLTCGHRSSTYDPFLDLSVPISSDAEPTPPKSFLGSLRHSVAGAGDSKSTLEKCLEKFTAEEVLDNENMYLCEKCSTKRKSIKTLSIFKYPRVLVIHIKRFRYSSARRVKLFDDVKFPTSGLNLEPFVSADLPPMAPATPVYDLIGVCNHHGTLNSGHYIAHADTSGAGARDPKKWMKFNDARVSPAQPSAVSGPTAYVLFYR